MVNPVPVWPHAFEFDVSSMGSMPAVTALRNGSFIAVWTQINSQGNTDIRTQLFNAAGAKIGVEFTVNTVLDGNQRDPAVAALDNGGFVVAWEDRTATAVQGAIFGTATEDDGTPKPPIKTFDVAFPNIPNNHANPSITALPDGGFVVSVTGSSVTGSSNVATSYVYNAQGTLRTATEYTSADQTRDTDLAVLQKNNQTYYVTVASVAGSGGNSHKVIAEIRSATGEQVKAAFEVASMSANLPAISVTALDDGRFVVAWTFASSVQAKIFNADGTGGDKSVELYRSNVNTALIPRIALEAIGGGFALALEESSSDGSSSEIYVKTFDLAGQGTGLSTKPYGNAQGLQAFPAISTLEDGRFVVNWSDGNGVHGRIFDPRKEVVNITGTDGNDSFYGTDFTTARDTLDGGVGDDVLNGLGGNDVLIGSSGGNDIFNGGTGIDAVSYFGAADIDGIGVMVFMTHTENNIGAATGDTYNSIEEIDGTNLADILEGDSVDNIFWGAGGDDRLSGLEGADTLLGAEGNDILMGGEGGDTLKGEDGNDWASYEGAGERVNVYLEDGAGYAGDAAGDVLESIENLIGSRFNDILRGDSGVNTIRGGGGDDIIEGRGGADHLDGGAGLDFADYFFATGAVAASLSDPRTNDGEGEAAGDTYNDIEGLGGSSFNDVLIGNSNPNELRGWKGNDTLDGGAGSDTVGLTGSRADYAVTLNQDGSVTLAHSKPDGDGTDTIRNVEVFQFNDAKLSLASLVAGAQRLLISDVVEENTATGINISGFLGSAKAGGPLSYALINNAEGRFTIDAATGTLKVANGVKLDYEQASQHIIALQVTDAAGGSTVKNVTILVQDVMHEVAVGSAGADVMKGGAGQDRFTSIAGDDQIEAGFGNDTLIGGAGKDVLTGGDGKDIFVFDTKVNKAANLDKINDFSVKDDGVWLENKVFTKLGKKGSEKKPAKLVKDFFTVGDKAKDADDYLIYNKKKGVLLYDADGSGSKKAVEIATLKKNLRMTEKDFFVI